jgi:tol-pal system protein YbgF
LSVKRGLTILLAATACGGALMALPARAGLFDDDEARVRIETLHKEINEHFQQVDGAVSTTTHNQVELTNQIEQVKADLARLRGQIEVLNYELDAAQKRQKDFYVDLDGRLRKLETAAAEESSAENAAPEALPADSAAEMRDYETALTHFKSARYKDALQAFEGFIKSYPGSNMLPSAHFWAASANYQLHDYAKASALFGKLVATWPSDAKAPDALLGQANSQQEAGDAKGARKTLDQLVGQYPNSSAAQTARLRLKKK